MEKLTRTSLRGIWVALLTPWTDEGELDETRYARDIATYANTGVHGLYTGGTTGEFYAQDDVTYERVTAVTVQRAHAIGLPVQIGVTALSTRIVRMRIRTAKAHKADALQVALPFWLELKDDEVIRFFREIAEEADRTPIIYYQTGRAKRKLPPALVGQLADELPQFIGMKETGSSPLELAGILKEAPDLSIFGGDDNLVEKMAVGAQGSYSAVAGLNAQRMVELYNAISDGRDREAREIQDEVRRMLTECLIPIAIEAGLEDSAIDRIQRIAGGGDVGLNCQSPYRPGLWKHVEQLVNWCNQHAPALLPSAVGKK